MSLLISSVAERLLLDLDNAVIWRYFSLSKFSDLLQSRALYFSPLSGFDDKHEGSYGKQDFAHVMSEVLPAFEAPVGATGGAGAIGEIGEFGTQEDYLRAMNQSESRSHMQDGREKREHIGISCWTKSQHESNALWRIYVPSGEGVAIRSTLSHLRGSFTPEDRARILEGDVQYVAERPETLSGGPFAPLVYKSHWYSYEQEIRFMVEISERNVGDDPRKVRVDLCNLVEGIVVFPGSGEWFVKLVEDLAATYGLRDTPVTRSAMDAMPLR